MDKQQEYLDFAKNLADAAGKIMLQYFNTKDIGTIAKEDSTPLTVADTAINELVIDTVKKTYPDHGVLGEEDSFATEQEYLWVCDPIDGTFPYSHGIPNSTFSLALCKKGVPQIAVIYEPFMNRLVSAIRGGGAWLNSQSIKLEDSYPHIGHQGLNIEVWTGAGSTLFTKSNLRSKVEESLAHQNYIQLYFCSVAYSGLLVATGQLTGLVMCGGSAWDLAAVDLIVKEAGGVVSDCFGNTQQQDFSKKQTQGIIAARTQAEFEDISSKVVPVFNAAERK